MQGEEITLAYEVKPNTGSLFKNDKKEADTHPDYKGSGLIDGVGEVWLDAWINTSNAGVKYMSLKFKPKEARQGGVQDARPAQNAQAYDPGLDDDIPFGSSDPSLEQRVG